MKNKDKNKTPNHSSFNEDTFKLLVTKERFQTTIADLRHSIGISEGGFKNENDCNEWYNAILNEMGTQTRYTKLEGSIKGIMREYGLTEDMYDPLRHYIFFNVIKVMEIGNYIFGWKPKIKDEESLEVTIRIYRKLSNKDHLKIQSDLKTLCRTQLPEHRKIANKPIKNIDDRIKSLSTPIGVTKEEKLNSHYLAVSQREYESGKITKQELENRKRLNKDKVIIIKHKTTSKTIAKQIFGGKKTPASVRKSNERLKNEIDRRFKRV